MEKRKNSNNLVYLLIIICIVLLVVLGFWLYVGRSELVDIEIFEVKFGVVDFGIGIDVSPGVLSFGSTIPGGSAERGVILRNNFNFPIRVEVIKSENVNDFLVVEPVLFLESAEILEVDIILIVPLDAALGEYSGDIKFEMYRTK